MNRSLIIFIGLVAVGCSGGSAVKSYTTQQLEDKAALVEKGMTYEEVIEILGSSESDNYDAGQKNGSVRYLDDKRTTTLDVIFMDGKVTDVTTHLVTSTGG